MLRSIYNNQEVLPDSVILKHASCADIKFKPINGRVQAYNNSLVPLTTQHQVIQLSANIVNIDCLVKFSEKLNELTNQCNYLVSFYSYSINHITIRRGNVFRDSLALRKALTNYFSIKDVSHKLLSGFKLKSIYYSMPKNHQKVTSLSSFCYF